MAGLTGTQIKATYGDVLNMGNGGAGITLTLKNVIDGLGNATALGLSSAAVSIEHAGGTFGTTDLQLSHDGTNGIVGLGGTGQQLSLRRNSSNDRIDITSVPDVRVNIGGGQILGLSGSACSIATAMQFGQGAGAPGGDDVALKRTAAGVFRTTNGGIGNGWLQSSAGEAALAAAFTNATATLAATNLSWTVAAGRSYRIHGVLQVSNSTAAEGIQLAFDGGTATATTFFAAASAVGSVVAGTVASTSLAGVINYTTITGTDYIVINGYLKVNAGGTLTLRAAENTTATGTLTIGAGSWIALNDTINL